MSDRIDELLGDAYQELSELQAKLGRKVTDRCVYMPTMETLDTMKEHGYVLEAMTAVLRVIKYRKGMLQRGEYDD